MRIVLLISLIFLLSHHSESQELYFPPIDDETWEHLDPMELDWCETPLEEMYQYLETNGTKSFLILKDGKIVIEKYFGDHNKNKQWAWFSAGKSLRALLVGIAQQNALLDIHDKTSEYLGLGWSSLDEISENLITIRNQLTMTSGLNENFFDCITAECLRKNSDAGSRWVYHNGPYNLLKEVLESATGTSINDYTKLTVRDKIGMNTGTWLVNGNNTFFVSTARDMARFGILIQNNGKWGETQILESTYYNQMVNTSQELNPSYGYLWWLNGKSSFIAPSSPKSINGPIAPNAPDDLITAAGAQGQFISISKSSGLMMIRQGQSEESDLAALPIIDEFWNRINSFENESCKSVTSLIEKKREPITIYPNPTSNNLMLLGIKEGTKFSVLLIDGSGKELLKTANTKTIDVSSIDRGIYYIRITASNQIRQVRVVIK